MPVGERPVLERTDSVKTFRPQPMVIFYTVFRNFDLRNLERFNLPTRASCPPDIGGHSGGPTSDQHAALHVSPRRERTSLRAGSP